MRLKDGSTAKTGNRVRVTLGERNTLHKTFSGQEGVITATSEPISSAVVNVNNTPHLFHGSVLESVHE